MDKKRQEESNCKLLEIRARHGEPNFEDTQIDSNSWVHPWHALLCLLICLFGLLIGLQVLKKQDMTEAVATEKNSILGIKEQFILNERVLVFVKKYTREGEEAFLRMQVGSAEELGTMVNSLPLTIPEVESREKDLLQSCSKEWGSVGNFQGRCYALQNYRIYLNSVPSSLPFYWN